MLAILSITPTGSVSTVSFDDGTSFRCTRDFLRRSNISRGQRIDPVFVDRLRESASYDLALSEADRLTRRNRYSRQEIAVKLRQAGLNDLDIRAALDTLAGRGELDDHHVALDLARRNLARAISRDPELTWSRFRLLYGRRLALRGFGAAESSSALREAWSEFENSPLARRP